MATYRKSGFSLGRRKQTMDFVLLFALVALTCFGVVMVYSASSVTAMERYQDGFFFLKRQGLFACLGFGVMAVAANLRYQALEKLAPLLLFASVGLLLMVFVPGMGVKAGGASRWVSLAGLSFQPAEVVKLVMVIFFAYSLSRKKDRVADLKGGFLPYMGLLSVMVGLVVLQPDLGNAMVMVALSTIMLLAAGTKIRHLSAVALISLPVLYFAVMNVAYRRRRIMAFLDPWEDPTDAGFQIIQSWVAFGTGGVFGVGLGASKQKLFYLPEAHTDFILSVIGEELGYAGVIAVAALFLLIAWRGIGIALRAPDSFGRYLAFGISVMLGLEGFVNILVALGALPTKGLTLPFISYGGTSLVVKLLAAGILLSVSRSPRTA